MGNISFKASDAKLKGENHLVVSFATNKRKVSRETKTNDFQLSTQGFEIGESSECRPLGFLGEGRDKIQDKSLLARMIRMSHCFPLRQSWKVSFKEYEIR